MVSNVAGVRTEFVQTAGYKSALSIVQLSRFTSQLLVRLQYFSQDRVMISTFAT